MRPCSVSDQFLGTPRGKVKLCVRARSMSSPPINCMKRRLAAQYDQLMMDADFMEGEMCLAQKKQREHIDNANELLKQRHDQVLLAAGAEHHMKEAERIMNWKREQAERIMKQYQSLAESTEPTEQTESTESAESTPKTSA